MLVKVQVPKPFCLYKDKSYTAWTIVKGVIASALAKDGYKRHVTGVYSQSGWRYITIHFDKGVWGTITMIMYSLG